MATLAVTATRKGAWLTFTWAAATGATDTFTPVYVNENISDVFIEASGTFDGSAVTLNGYVTTSTAASALVDTDGTAISFAAAGSKAIREVWPWFQPVTDAVGTTEAIVVTIYAKVVK